MNKMLIPLAIRECL